MMEKNENGSRGNILYTILQYLSALSFVSIFVLLGLGFNADVIGAAVVTMFISLAIGVRGTDTVLRDFAFSIWVFASVAAAMFYPAPFTELGGVELSVFIVPLIQIIMFGMGTSLSIQDFVGVVKMPKGVIVGLICQFTIMPVLGITLALSFGFSAEIAAGVVLVGSSPSGVASNVMTYIAGANLALSVTLTAIGTLLAPLATPFLMQLLAGQFVPIDFLEMMWSIINMIILPVVLGVLFNRYLHGKAQWLDDIMPTISMTGIVVILGIMTAGGRDSILTLGFLIIVAGVIHNLAGYFFGYWGCRLSGLDEKSCRTIAFEVGMQNAGMASGIAVEMGKIATVGVPSVIFGSWMNVSGSALANWWRRKALVEETEQGDATESAKEGTKASEVVDTDSDN
ncbi:bile acid:sodium symporter family protein [Halalkalibaculum sp. DA384]|uniref:bile acid:sodium symporter family protein n=1 Tax=Halalkalibaculum sp. DA384 TaxID=3373606 RepID=UPI003753FD7B